MTITEQACAVNPEGSQHSFVPFATPGKNSVSRCYHCAVLETTETHPGMLTPFEGPPDLAAIAVEVVELTAEKKAVSARLEDARRRLLEGMDNADLDQVKSAAGPMAYVSSRAVFALNDGNRPEVMEWLREHGRGELVREDVNRQTLSAEIKKMQNEGIEMPEFLGVRAEPSLGIRANGYVKGAK